MYLGNKYYSTEYVDEFVYIVFNGRLYSYKVNSVNIEITFYSPKLE